MKYLLTLIVSSCNREDFIRRLIHSINLDVNQEVCLIVIDDNSKKKYPFISKKNFIFVRKNKNQHKFRNFLSVRKYINSWFIAFLDDKDFFYEDSIKKILKILKSGQKKFLYVLDMYQNKKIIGKEYRSKSLLEHKNFRCDFGDKLIIIPAKKFIDYNVNLKKFINEKIYNYDLFIEELLDIKTIHIKGEFIDHKYLDNGVTKNNLKYKRENFIYRSELLKIQLSKKSSFKYKTYKLFERWLIRKEIYLPIKNKWLRIMNFFLAISFSYYFILLIYNYKLRKITEIK